MNIGIIDADLLLQQDHNFPNLALMKLSGYYKSKGHTVNLINFNDINKKFLFQKKFDKIFMSKVFTKPDVPKYVFNTPNLEYGGTGFFYDKAPKLPKEIEHHFPDYHLYDDWMKYEIRFNGRPKKYFKYYTDFAIGFTTRGCFRHCEFCVNRNENKAYIHSPLSEFVGEENKKICLLDDNILGCGDWERIIGELRETGKPFQYKQGLDIRILTDKKAEMLCNSKYEGNYIFAFDNISDRDLIIKKLTLWNKYVKKQNPTAVLYCFCCFDRNGKYDKDFWVSDINDLLERAKILMQFGARPYVMQFEKYKESPKFFKMFYRHIKGWCNSGNCFQKQSIREYCHQHEFTSELNKFEKEFPEIGKKYFDLRYTDYYKK